MKQEDGEGEYYRKEVRSVEGERIDRSENKKRGLVGEEMKEGRDENEMRLRILTYRIVGERGRKKGRSKEDGKKAGRKK